MARYETLVSMAPRMAVLVALIAVALFLVTTARTPRAVEAQVSTPKVTSTAAVSAPAPMFSSWYGEALRNILLLEETDVAKLEQQLAANPEDFPARLKLMAYHQRGDRIAHPEDQAKRIKHVLWLILNHPESELLHSPVSRFDRNELSSATYRRMVELWDIAVKTHPKNAAVQRNAASFFEEWDPDRYLRYAEATVAADPNDAMAIRGIAHRYAMALLENGPSASHAEAALEASKNVWVLGNTAYELQSQYNLSLQMGRPNPRAATLAERYFVRALALNPTLDRKAILPQIDLRAIAGARQAAQESRREWAAKFEGAAAKIRRLPIDAFPDLPAVVAKVLRDKNCTVPQPAIGSGPQNVIRGEFLAKGETGWAVLCSVNQSTSLLVFRNHLDTNPQVLNTGQDSGYLQGLGNDEIGYSRAIGPVNRDYIISHYRAYGGPEPPPLDHHGIDDAFIEKASSIWYFHEGKWLQLAGAD
jgi:hypothetical protein